MSKKAHDKSQHTLNLQKGTRQTTSVGKPCPVPFATIGEETTPSVCRRRKAKPPANQPAIRKLPNEIEFFLPNFSRAKIPAGFNNLP
jgi:hypothetical protein